MTTYAWHVHHDKLMELLTEPIENRIAYITKSKRKDEQALRLRLLKPVRGKLPAMLIRAQAARDNAWAAREKARAAYVKAGAAYVKAQAARDEAQAAYDKALNMPGIERLHAAECPDCPWDGDTIFRL